MTWFYFARGLYWRWTGAGNRRSLPPIDFQSTSTLGYLKQTYPTDEACDVSQKRG